MGVARAEGWKKQGNDGQRIKHLLNCMDVFLILPVVYSKFYLMMQNWPYSNRIEYLPKSCLREMCHLLLAMLAVPRLKKHYILGLNMENSM